MSRSTKVVYPPDAFKYAWSAAGQHLWLQGQGALIWLCSDFRMPMPEHFAFRVGNQLFFVWIETEDLSPLDDDRRALLQRKALLAQGHGCVLPLRRRGSEFAPAASGWSLFDVTTNRPVDPVAMVSDEPIVMTDWEIYDFAISVVRDRLAKNGFDVTDWQSQPGIEPAIWFAGKNDLEWVVVRAGRYPELVAPIPSNIADIRKACAPFGVGHFASVGVVSPDDPLNPDGSNIVPLLRGHKMLIRFDGLRALQ
jgi:hypothetical protein